MKTLEITTESGTYLVVELPEGSKNLRILPSFKRPVGVIDCFNSTITFDYRGSQGFEHLDGIKSHEWQLIGSGKDYPKLVKELGLLQENPVKPEYTHFEESTMEAVQRYNRQLVEYEQAESKVFKNPAILKKQ